MQSVMNYDMASAPTMSAPRASFNRSHGHKTTIDFDNLYPVYYDEVYPGDTFTMNPTIWARLNSPLDVPLCDNMFVDIHFFYVPMRQLWDNSRKFFGEQVDPGDSIDYRIPYMAATATTGYSELSLHDYLGLPTKVPDYEHVALYHRAYAHIYNEWFRDQNLIDSVTMSTADGPDTTTNTSILKRGKRHDYFTSGLVSPQKSIDGAVDLPLGTTAPITGLGKYSATYSLSSVNSYETDGSGATNYSSATYVDGAAANNTAFYVEEDPNNAGYPNIRADLSNATAATIVELRTAMAIQALLELDARAGTRYNEIVYSTFGVSMIDLTYKPEFLSGGSAKIELSSVPQTSNDGTNGNVGELSAYGSMLMSDGGFTKSFTEHGVVLGIISARADLTYQQGLDKLMSRETRYDYLYPILQGIGDDVVYHKEINCQDPTTDTGSTGTPDNDKVFCYQERYAELKYKKSQITGRLRSNCTTPLDVWHLSQEFSGLVSFDQTFIEQDTPIDRVLSVTTEPHLTVDMYFNLQCARPMQLYSIPGMGTRF
jgi:hypothetical protein